jgi:hypothetical protein
MSFATVAAQLLNFWFMIRKDSGFVTSVYRQADFVVGLRHRVIGRRHLPRTSFKYCYSGEIRSRPKRHRCGGA